MPVHVHSGLRPTRPRTAPYVGMYITEVTWWSARPLWFLLWSGVFERHPGLRFVVTECGALLGSPTCCGSMDTVLRPRARRPRSSASGSLGEARRCARASTSTATAPSARRTRRRRELARRYEIGVGNIMWGNDFPHPEGTWPHTGDGSERVPRHPRSTRPRQMLGLNQADVYGFDVDALGPLADSVGPTPADLGQVTDDDPTGARLDVQWAQLKEVGRHWLTGHDFALLP